MVVLLHFPITPVVVVKENNSRLTAMLYAGEEEVEKSRVKESRLGLGQDSFKDGEDRYQSRVGRRIEGELLRLVVLVLGSKK